MMHRRASAWGSTVSRALVALVAAWTFVAPPAHAETAEPSLRERIEAFVRARMDHPVSEISVPPLGEFDLTGVDPETVDIDLSTRASGRPASTVAVSVVMSDGRRVLKRGVVTVRIRTERAVVVATRRLARGEAITASDVRVERREAGSVPASAVEDPDRVIGMATRRSIGAGAPVRTDWLERPAAVERGQRVRLILQGPNLRIDAVGTAMSRGAVGDAIRVVNSDSRRELVGRVAPDGAVHVAF